MNLVDALLNADTNAILAEKTKEYEVERLSKALGEKFVLVLKSIPAKRYSEIQNIAVNIKSKKKSIDLYKLRMLTLNEGIKESNLADEKIMKKFGAKTPFEVYEKLFLTGEITDISEEISVLSGYDEKEKEEDIDEIKNL